MLRFTSFLLICALFLGQGFSANAAMCVHRSAAAHARALESRDGAVAATAENEDSAAALIAKKVAVAGAAGLVWVAHLPAPTMLRPLPVVAQPVTMSLADAPALNGISTLPLLRPPLATM